MKCDIIYNNIDNKPLKKTGNKENKTIRRKYYMNNYIEWNKKEQY